MRRKNVGTVERVELLDNKSLLIVFKKDIRLLIKN